MSDIDYHELRSNLKDSIKRDGVPFPSYAEALFSQVFVSRKPISVTWKKESSKAKSEPPEFNRGPSVATKEKPPEISERKEVFEALEKFVDKSQDEKASSEVSFPGGTIAKKEQVSEGTIFKSTLESSVWPKIYSESGLLNADSSNFHVKVLFIGESPKDFNEEELGTDLLSKMIKAMKLSPDEFIKVFITKDQEQAQKEWETVLSHLPEGNEFIVVSLGALATNITLGRKERLSRVHGQVFSKQLKGHEQDSIVHIYPVFHPDILKINPNMKRSAWIDLQKVMGHLAKSI